MSRVINAFNDPFSSFTTGQGTSGAYLVEDAIAFTVSARTESGITSSVLTVQVSNDTVERIEPVTVRGDSWSDATGITVDGTQAVYEGPPGVRFVRVVRDTSVGGVETRAFLNKLVG